MKKLRTITADLLILVLVFITFPLTALAEESYGYQVIVDPLPVAIGKEVVLTVQLTDYTSEKSGIRGFQIDINDVDGVLKGAECTSLVTDTEEVISNTAKYQPGRDIVRHAYVKMSGTMSYEDSNLLRVKFKIPETYTAAGTLELPLQILIQNKAGDQLTYKDTIRIQYAPASEIPDKPDTDIVSVDVNWGDMLFSYSDGTWNPQTHTYEGAGWTDEKSGYVTVKNTGSTTATAKFIYSTDRKDIEGSFDIAGSAEIVSGEEVTAWLKLLGKPEETLKENTVIGTATVEIGGE